MGIEPTSEIWVHAATRERDYAEMAEPRWRLRCIAGPCNQSIDYSRPMPRTFFPSALAPANAGYAASLAENRIVGCNERSGPPAPSERTSATKFHSPLNL